MFGIVVVEVVEVAEACLSVVSVSPAIARV